MIIMIIVIIINSPPLLDSDSVDTTCHDSHCPGQMLQV